MSSDDILAALEGRVPFPSDKDDVPPNRYVVEHDTPESLTVEEDAGGNVVSKLWFQTPPLNAATIERINAVQLLAESHDQGWCSDRTAGNWTWFELGIVAADGTPRRKDGVELVWESHRNRLGESEFAWNAGVVFGPTHDMLALLQPDDSIVVRLCARFFMWQNYARQGRLLMDVAPAAVERPPPPPYSSVIDSVKSIDGVFAQVNSTISSAFIPSLPENLFDSARALGRTDEAPLRVLSLDGGGVRGISSLMLLKAVLDKCAPGMLPCEVFDMIGGTSTGGYIAIMLGRLRMSIDECIATYLEFMKEIFVDKSDAAKKWALLWDGAFYPAAPLEELIKGLIKAKCGDENEPLVDPNDQNPKCKVFCMAVHQDAVNNRGPMFLRSYTNPLSLSALPGIKIWEAARATSAAPAYFAPLEVGGYTLVDGGLGANNPVGWLWTEVLGVFGPLRTTECFLSIGTGIPPNEEVNPRDLLHVAGQLASAATNTEIVNLLFRSLIDAFAPRAISRKYFRLNVSEVVPPSGPGELPSFVGYGALDDTGAVPKLQAATTKWIAANGAIIVDCAKTMARDLLQVQSGKYEYAMAPAEAAPEEVPAKL